jgi:hypothetical protein
MSKALARRRRSGLRGGRRNPTKTAVGTALKWLGTGALVGAAVGGIGAAAGATQASIPIGMLGGGSAGVAVTSLVGLVVGLVSPKNRDAGFVTAGVGLGSLLAVNLVTTTTMSAKA